GGTTTAYAAQSTDGSPFVQLRVEHSDKCLTVESGKIGGGAKTVQQTCADDLDNQLFELKAAGSGNLSVRAKHSGRCLSAGNSSDWDVAQYFCSGDSSQNWRVMMVEVAKGLYELRPADVLEYCLTIPGASHDDGVKATVVKCDGASSQRWRLQQASS
ncbi:RICIN domain-containing protein, partial [Streptomyces roseifaciens]